MNGEMFECLALVFPVPEIGGGDAIELMLRVEGIRRRHSDEPFRLRIGQGPKHNRIDYAEDRAVSADTERESHYRDNGKTGLCQQHSKPISKVSQESLHWPPPRPDDANPLLENSQSEACLTNFRATRASG